jgi:hypothetical protein
VTQAFWVEHELRARAEKAEAERDEAVRRAEKAELDLRGVMEHFDLKSLNEAIRAAEFARDEAIRRMIDLAAEVGLQTQRAEAAEAQLHKTVEAARRYVDMTQWLDIDFADAEEEAEAEKALEHFKAVLDESPP